MKDSNSNRVNDSLLHNTKPVTLYYKFVNVRDTDKKFELKRDLLKMITNKNYNVDLANLSDKKLRYDFAKEMYFDVKAPSNKRTRDRTLKKLLKPPAIMVSGLSIIFLPSDPNELCDRLKLLLHGKQASNYSDFTNDEIVAIFDKL